MPRGASVAPRTTLQTSTSTSRTGQKQISRLSSSARPLFADSPKVVVEQAAAAKNDLDEVPDSQPSGSHSRPMCFVQEWSAYSESRLIMLHHRGPHVAASLTC